VEEEADSDIDFEEESEEATQRVSSSDTVLTRNVNFDPKASPDATRPAERRAMSRSKSLATVKATRRARLAEKLREIFDLQEIDEVIAGRAFFSPDVNGANCAPC
jgi:sterol 3beta-glucosyltransferase